MNLFYHDTRSFVDEDTTFQPIEPGQYPAMIIEAGERTSTTTGAKYAYVKVEIIDGKFKGRKVFDNMFRNSTNEKAVTIAQKKLQAICTSLGIVELKEPNMMLFKPLNVKVAIDKQDTSKNIIMGYGPKSSMPSPAVIAATTQQPKNPINTNDVPF